jgi:2',3'-cyclic-nucleotide 2'-phosphodiesterase/3'-nucleotidase
MRLPKAVRFIVSLCLLWILSGVNFATAQSTTTITLLQTTDLHANLVAWDYYTGQNAEWGLAKVATLIKQERALDPDALLLDSGDTIQGTPLGYYYSEIDKNAPHPMAVTMNALGYDVAALGNHEFNYGPDTLNRWIGQLNFPVLSANIRKSDGSEAFTPYIIKEVKGVKIGILGMTTPHIPNWEKAENIVGLRFDDPVETAKQYVPQIRAEGADIVVVVQHIGWDKTPASTSSPDNWLTDPSTWVSTNSPGRENTTVELAESVPGIDVILAGHSHLDVPKTIVNGVLIIESSYWGRSLGKVTLELQKDGDSWQVISKDSKTTSVGGVAQDDELYGLAHPYHDQTVQYINTPVGNAAAAFEGGPRGRYADGALADLINTVQSEAAAEAGYPVDISVAALFVDAGQIPAGQITLRDVYSTYIYDNTLYVIEINGDILRRALEANASYFRTLDPNNLPADPKGVVAENKRDYAYDLFSGIDYTYDLTKPEGERLVKLQFKGVDVTPEQTFRVAINNYRAVGGAGFPMYREGTQVWGSTSEIRDLMAAYAQKHGTIDPAAVNVKNYTLIPDLYTHYFGAAPVAPAPSQPEPAPQPAPVPAELPRTGGENNWPALVLVALVVMVSGLYMRLSNRQR